MKLAKRFGYKLIIILCIIVTCSSFLASTPVYASKVNKTDFYYSGTSKGSYTVNENKFLATLIATLQAILDYLLGLCTMGFRMVFVGWTALFERCLTLIIQGASGDDVDVDGVSATSLFSADGWITLDAIFFNHIPLLDINFFNMEPIEGYDSTGSKIEEGETKTHESPMIVFTEDEEVIGTVQTKVVQGEKRDFKADPPEDKKSLIIILKETVAGWYYVLRLISIMVMLVLLMYIGIQMAMRSSAADRAVYKKMLVDWVVGMIFVFFIHYIMLFVITVNETLVHTLEALRTGAKPMAVYEYGLEERAKKPISNEEMELTLYDEVKTRAYDIKMTVGTTGMIMYMVLVYYAWKYTFIYLKRYLTVAVLVIMAPLVAVSYAYNKVRTGKSTIFSKWLKEFIFIVLLQTVHALIYLVFIQTALAMSLQSISGFILAMVMLNFMTKAESIFRKIFGINGALTNEIAEGAGLRDTMKGLGTAMGVMSAGKIAKGYTKAVTKVATKPIRELGGATFKGIMDKRAARLDKKATEYAQDHKLEDTVKSYSDMKKHKREKRAETLRVGNILKNLENGTLDVDELEADVNSLHEGDTLYDANNTMIGIVTPDYIKKRKKELDEIKAVAYMHKDTKDFYREDYAKYHNKKGKLKKYQIYAGDKIADILDPSQYVKKGEDGKYRAIKNQTEYGEVHGKFFTYRFGKRIDGATYRLAKQLKFSNIAGLDEEEKQALQKQVSLIKSEMTGFLGILVGMPLLVAQPNAGMVAMSVGISEASKANSGIGFKRRKNISHYSLDAQGNYVFNRFEGSSEHTIAEGSKSMARRAADKIAAARVKQDETMKKNVTEKHPKIAMDLKKSANTGAALGFVSAVTFGGVVAGLPAFTAVVAGAASAKLTGSILKGRYGNNAWAQYQDTMRAARKADLNKLEKDEKKYGTANFFSEAYFGTEQAQLEKDTQGHAQKFEEAYGAIVVQMQNEINEKSKEEVFRDTAYEEPIEVTKTPEGKSKISLDSENKLIDDAIVEYAQKSGIMDVAKINVEDKMDDIEKILKKDLVTRGVIQNDQEIGEIIENFTDRVKDRQVQIEKSGQSKKVVEQKMAGEAIVSVMQEKGITDPTAVSTEEVLDKFIATYQEKTAETMQSSQKSNNVLESLNMQKADGSTPRKAFDIESLRESATEAISAKKVTFADKAKQPLDESIVVSMKQVLKRKEEIKLDERIMEREIALENAGSAIVANENGGISAVFDDSVEVQDSSSSKIVEMLQLQTQLHKDKKKLSYVNQRLEGTETAKRKAMNMELGDTAYHGGDGSKRFDTTKDGSQRVPTDKQTITDIGEILKRKKQDLRV